MVGEGAMKEYEIRPARLFADYLACSRADCERFFSDQRDFFAASCPACGAREAELAFTKHSFQYVECASCRTLYVSPRPSDDSINRYYREGEAAKFWADRFFRDTEEARREKIFAPRARLVEDLAKRYCDSPSVRLADVGAGFGVFAEEVIRGGRFSRVIAIEPGSELAKVCREKGLEVHEATVEELSSGASEFDVATSFEVLEHLYSPLQFVGAVKRLLKPGGIALFTTLTVDGFDIQTLWRESDSVYPPHHINMMSLAGIERLMERAGVEVLEVSTPGELDVDIVSNYREQNGKDSVPRFVSRILDGGERTRRAFQEFLKANSLSSHVRVVIRKGRTE